MHEPAPFGRMVIETSRGLREVFLGPASRIRPERTTIDWRRAPLAEVFFSCAPGDDYEVELEDRLLEGRLVERQTLGFEPAALELSAPTTVREPLAEAELVLDPAQQAAVDLPPGRSLLVLGEPGFGKTTVALYRAASLARRAKRTGDGFRGLVLVPTQGLCRLASALLRRLGQGDRVEVAVFDDWILARARRAFPRLPSATGRDATVATRRLKRHPALRAVLPEVAAGTTGSPPPWKPWPPGRATRHDLLHLLGDSLLLDRVLDAAKGDLPAHARSETLEHTRVQFSDPAEVAWSHVDPERLATLDGLNIDEGTPMQDAGTVDTEDGAVLFELNVLRCGSDATAAAPKPRRWHHLVLDEAQEFTPLELAVIGRALLPGGSITVAGDVDQHTSETSSTTAWRDALRELGLHRPKRLVLEIAYRCPSEVLGFARRVLAESGPWPAPTGGIVTSHHPHPFALCEALTRELRCLLDSSPRSRVAVVCRRPEGARRLAALLERGVDCGLVADGADPLRPGLVIASLAEVKGLEFDVVVAPDLDPVSWPDEPLSRRALRVAATRASHQLWLATVGSWSPLVASHALCGSPRSTGSGGSGRI